MRDHSNLLGTFQSAAFWLSVEFFLAAIYYAKLSAPSRLNKTA